MKFARIGAFGAMAYTVGKFGLAYLGPLATLIGTFWFTSILFVIIVLGAVAWIAGFSILRFQLPAFAGSVSSVFTSQGIMTSLKMRGSGHTPTCLPRWPPRGLTQAVFGTSPLLMSR
jgi:aerobic C4-dicarboxylate transport protein